MRWNCKIMGCWKIFEWNWKILMKKKMGLSVFVSGFTSPSLVLLFLAQFFIRFCNYPPLSFAVKHLQCCFFLSLLIIFLLNIGFVSFMSLVCIKFVSLEVCFFFFLLARNVDYIRCSALMVFCWLNIWVFDEVWSLRFLVLLYLEAWLGPCIPWFCATWFTIFGFLHICLHILSFSLLRSLWLT